MSTVPPASTPPPPPGPTPPQQTGRKVGCWIVGCGGCIGLIVLVIAGAIGVGYFAMGKIEDQIRAAIAEEPAVVAHVGEIEDLSIAWGRSVEEASEAGAEFGQTILAISVTGTLGDAIVVARLRQDASSATGMVIAGGFVELSDGTRVDLRGDEAGAPSAESEGAAVEEDAAGEAATAAGDGASGDAGGN